MGKVINVHNLQQLEVLYVFTNFYFYLKDKNPEYQIEPCRSFSPKLEHYNLIEKIVLGIQTDSWSLDYYIAETQDEYELILEIAKKGFTLTIKPFESDLMDISFRRLADAGTRVMCDVRMLTIPSDERRDKEEEFKYNFYNLPGRIGKQYSLAHPPEMSEYINQKDDFNRFLHHQLHTAMKDLIRYCITRV
jgi:hypothetical protein